MPECLGFWGRKADRTATREVLDVMSVTGGVPKYLSEIDPSLSADENGFFDHLVRLEELMRDVR